MAFISPRGSTCTPSTRRSGRAFGNDSTCGDGFSASVVRIAFATPSRSIASTISSTGLLRQKSSPRLKGSWSTATSHDGRFPVGLVLPDRAVLIELVVEVADARRDDALPARYLANRVGEADVGGLAVDRRGVIQHEGVDAAADVDAPASRSFMPRKRTALISTSSPASERYNRDFCPGMTLMATLA